MKFILISFAMVFMSITAKSQSWYMGILPFIQGSTFHGYKKSTVLSYSDEITFNKNKTFIHKYNDKQIEGKYDQIDTDIILTYENSRKLVIHVINTENSGFLLWSENDIVFLKE